MKNVLFPRLVIIFCFTVLISSCSKDGDAGVVPCSASWATDLNSEFTAVTSAAQVYATNPSAANCNSLKTAYQNYINELKPYGNCATLAGQSRDDWQKAVSDAEAQVAAMCQ